MKKDLEKRLDGVYTRLLIRAQKLSWKDDHTLADKYGNITPISRRRTSRRHRFVGHCFRNKSQTMSDLILWKHPSRRKGKHPLNYIDAVSRDINFGYEELHLQLCQIEPTAEILFSALISPEVEGSKFNNYLNTVNILINSHEPQGKLNKKQRKFEQKPWITWGMENSIHQNRLYRNYTRRNIKNIEKVLYDECRAYRNNFSTLMIQSKKKKKNRN